MNKSFTTPFSLVESDYNGSNTFVVQNLQEAIELAKEMKATGVYDIFRGQASMDWLVESSFTRLIMNKGIGYQESNEYKDPINLLSAVLKDDPLTSHLADNDETLFAIAQHYGLPTNYVDFTTDPEVAGFFAVYKRPAHIRKQISSIVCINIGKFYKESEVCKFYFEHEAKLPKVIEIDVQNLWRLQCQKGLFLYLPGFMTEDQKVQSFEDYFFGFDRIVFPYNEETAIEPSPEVVYPSSKSALENVLDHFFNNLRKHNFFKYIDDKAKENPNKIRVLDFISYDDPGLIFMNNVEIDESWNEKKISPWTPEINENWNQVITDQTIFIQVNYELNKTQLKDSIKNFISKALAEYNSPKNYVLKFSLEVINCDHLEFYKKDLIYCLERIWNGMRFYPYTIEEITESLINYLIFEYEAFKCYVIEKTYSPERFFYNDPLYCVLAAKYNSTETRAHVEKKDFVNALRNNFIELLKPEKKDAFESRDWYEIFHNLKSPKYLFDFNRLNTLFVTQIIPNQIYRRGAERNFPILFSPTQLMVIAPD